MSALLDLNTNRWSSLVASPDVGTLGASSGRSAWTGRDLALFGAATSPVAGLLYDPASSLWRRPTAVAAPDFLIGALAKSGDHLLLQGSASSNYPQAALRFALFDALSNGWQAVPELTGRSFPTVVFTGKRILVWGGTRIEIDPNGKTGCENPPPGYGCDPATPTKQIPLTDGVTYGL